MSSDKSVIVKIDGDSSSLQKEFNKVKTEAQNLEDSLKDLAKISTVAFAGLGAALTGVIKSFREDEQALFRTEQVLKSTGYAAGLAKHELVDLANSLQDVTTYADATILGGENLLLTFKNIGGDVFPRATAAMLDMATAMGQDVSSTAIQMGKALNAPTEGLSALSRVGVQFTDQQKEIIENMVKTGNVAGAQAIILTELESQFGGAAAAAAKGTGKLIQLNEVVSNITSKIGELSFQILEPFVDKLLYMARAIRDGDSAFSKIAAKILTYGTILAGVLATTSALALSVFGLTTALGVLKAAIVAVGLVAQATWARMTLGLSLVAAGTYQLVQEMGGLTVVVDKIKAGFQVLANEVDIFGNKAILLANKVTIAFQETKRSLIDLAVGFDTSEASKKVTKSIDDLKLANESLILQNKELRKSYADVYNEISAETAANKILEQGESERAAREENAALEAERLSAENEAKAAAELVRSQTATQAKIDANAIDREIQKLDLELEQAIRDQASEVEKTKLMQKIAGLKTLRDKDLDDQKKTFFKNQDELRAAEIKDQNERLKFKKQFQDDTLSGAISLGKNMVKEGSAAQKALFLVEKAGALKSAIMNTAKAYNMALANPPGPPFSMPQAILAGAMGAVQVAAIAGTAIGLEKGGMVNTGVRTGDRHPAMLADGELVVPRKNFDEVVTATARSRGLTDTNLSKVQDVRVLIDFTPSAAEYITAAQLENAVLNVDRS
jgi:hypothetical protein